MAVGRVLIANWWVAIAILAAVVMPAAVVMYVEHGRRHMHSAKIPAWETDLLSQFFADAEYNDRATSLNYPTVFALLQRTNSIMQSIEGLIEHDNDEALIVPRFLIVRARASFLAAIRLAMSGQLPETFAILRLAIEQAWYGLHIAKDPSPTLRSKVWLCRNDSDEDKAACKQEFTVRNVSATHEQLDHDTAKQLHSLYETMIDFGAHPNQLGTLASTSKGEGEDQKQITHQVGILYPVPVPQLATIRLAISVAVGAIKVSQLVYPDRLQTEAINVKIGQLVTDLNSVFKPWAPK
jgi:hypothetical protein